jgi:putative exporter of polyketide antibiotics
MTDLLDKFGVQGTFLRQYLGVAFLMIAAIVSLLPASQIGASAEEETSGRLVHVIAQPVRRVSLMTGRLALAVVSVAIAGILAGVFAWAGARVQGVDPGFATTLKAGLNVVPTALLVLGSGAVVRCLWPRFSTTAMYGVVAWSFIADLLASLVESTKWLGHLSIFHYMALAPAAAIDVGSVLVTLVAAAVLLVVAVALFARRDMQTG